MGSLYPLISLIIPVYGVEKYIERCARSLFEQTYENLEFIFVNDCTKDSSIKILLNTIEEYPSRKAQVRIINHERNIGLAGARNTGVENASGLFLCHIDSDDWVSPTLIQRCYEVQTQKDADIVSTNAKAIHKRFTEKLFRYTCNPSIVVAKQIVLRKKLASIWGLLIRTSLYKDNNIKCEVGKNYGEDYLITPKLYYFARNVDSVDEYLYFYNCTNSGSYVHNIGVHATFKKLENIESLGNFFAKNDVSFNSAITEIYVRTLLDGIIDCSFKKNGEESDKMRRKLPLNTKEYLSNIPLSSKLVYYLKNQQCLILYAKILMPLRRAINLMKVIIKNFI